MINDKKLDEIYKLTKVVDSGINSWKKVKQQEEKVLKWEEMKTSRNEIKHIHQMKRDIELIERSRQSRSRGENYLS